jgi:hypothetical protein
LPRLSWLGTCDLRRDGRGGQPCQDGGTRTRRATGILRLATRHTRATLPPDACLAACAQVLLNTIVPAVLLGIQAAGTIAPGTHAAKVANWALLAVKAGYALYVTAILPYIHVIIMAGEVCCSWMEAGVAACLVALQYGNSTHKQGSLPQAADSMVVFEVGVIALQVGTWRGPTALDRFALHRHGFSPLGGRHAGHASSKAISGKVDRRWYMRRLCGLTVSESVQMHSRCGSSNSSVRGACPHGPLPPRPPLARPPSCCHRCW